MKLAKAERGSARAHADANATADAERSVGAAQAERRLLDQHIVWLRAEVSAAEAREEEANAEAWAAEADYELARARLIASDRPPGDAHLQAFVKQAESCHERYEDARHRHAQRRAEADAEAFSWRQARDAALQPA